VNQLGQRIARRVIGGIALASLTALPLAALDPSTPLTQLGLDIWRAEDGLPQESIQALIQDAEGYLWIATQEGLARFDGVRFVTFDSTNTEAFRSDFLQTLLLDRDGTLWIGTGEGLVSMRDGVFTHHAFADGGPASIEALTEDPKGRLWVGTQRGLARMEGGVLRLVADPGDRLGGTVFSLALSPEGALWVGSNRGLHRLEGEDLTTWTTTEGLPHNDVVSLLTARDGSLWIGTQSGLCQWTAKGLRSYGIDDGLSSHIAWSLHEDPTGAIWVGTNDGLTRLIPGPQDSTLSVLGLDDGLAGSEILALLEDREGSLWLGTSRGGLHRLREVSVATYTAEDGLSGDSVYSMVEDRQGTLWVATTAGLNQRVGDGWRWYSVDDGLPSDELNCLLEDRQGALWIGTYNGLSRFSEGVFTNYRQQDGPDGLIHNMIFALEEDRDGTLWIGTDGGVSRLRDGVFQSLTDQDGLPNNSIRAILATEEGVVWFGTEGGLSRYQDGTFTTFLVEDGLPSHIITALHQDQDGALWIGTLDGLARRVGDRITRYTPREGLHDGIIYSILEDDRGSLWMSTNHGIFSVTLAALNALAEGTTERLTSTSYDRSDGMISSECNGGVQPAALKTAAGTLWFPTTRGVAIIDPAHIVHTPAPPAAKIEEVEVNRHPLPHSEASPDGPWKAPVGFGEVGFRFTALSFLAPEQIRFRYRLEGFDRDWSEPTTQRTARYTNLPPRRYTFRVQAAHKDGLWNETGAAVNLVLFPPLYRAPWFLLLLGVAVLGSVIGGVRWRVLRLQRRAAALEATVQERTAEVVDQRNQLAKANRELETMSRERAEFLAIAAHDLRSPLLNIRGFASELGLSIEELTHQLTTAAHPPADQNPRVHTILHQDMPGAAAMIDASADRMERLVASILHLSRLGRRELDLETLDMNRLVQGILNTLAYQIDHHPARVVVGDLPSVTADSTSMELILENLLDNAVKYLRPGVPGRIEIRGWETEGEVLYEIEDNGRGIPPGQYAKVFRIFGRGGGTDIPGEGMGLAYVNTLIRRHGGRIEFEPGEDHGTLFRFAFPHREPEFLG